MTPNPDSVAVLREQARHWSADEAATRSNAEFAVWLQMLTENEQHGSTYAVAFDQAARRIAALSAQGEAVATVEAWSHGETYLHWHTSAMEFPAGAKLYLHPAPPGADAVTEEMVETACVAQFGAADWAKVVNPHNRKLLRDAVQRGINAALAARTGKGEG